MAVNNTKITPQELNACLLESAAAAPDDFHVRNQLPDNNCPVLRGMVFYLPALQKHPNVQAALTMQGSTSATYKAVQECLSTDSDASDASDDEENKKDEDLSGAAWFKKYQADNPPKFFVTRTYKGKYYWLRWNAVKKQKTNKSFM